MGKRKSSLKTMHDDRDVVAMHPGPGSDFVFAVTDETVTERLERIEIEFMEQCLERHIIERNSELAQLATSIIALRAELRL